MGVRPPSAQTHRRPSVPGKYSRDLFSIYQKERKKEKKESIHSSQSPAAAAAAASRLSGGNWGSSDFV